MQLYHFPKTSCPKYSLDPYLFTYLPNITKFQYELRSMLDLEYTEVNN